MESKFKGLWKDLNGNHAVIIGHDGKVSVQFIDVPSRPVVFHGTEQDPAIAPAFVDVDFSDVHQVIRGTLQNDGQDIIWGNHTKWVKVALVGAATT